jgi:hypothetical protein
MMPLSFQGFAPMLSRSLIAVLAITIGLPFLILLGLVFSGSGASTGIFTSVLTIAVLSMFLMLMIFEIKRIADLPPDAH